MGLSWGAVYWRRLCRSLPGMHPSPPQHQQAPAELLRNSFNGSAVARVHPRAQDLAPQSVIDLVGTSRANHLH